MPKTIISRILLTRSATAIFIGTLEQFQSFSGEALTDPDDIIEWADQAGYNETTITWSNGEEWFATDK